MSRRRAFFAEMARATSQLQEMTVHPLEATPLVGHVAIRVLSGRIRILGYDFAPASDDEDEHWLTLHSPAGGLTAVLQTPSAISCAARVLLRSLSESIGLEAATAQTSVKRKRQAKELEADVYGEDGEGGEGGEGGEDGEDDLDDPIDDLRPSAPGRGRAASTAGNSAVEEARLGIRLLKGVPSAIAEERLGALVPVAWAAALQTLAGSLSVPLPDTASEDEQLRSESPPARAPPASAAVGSSSVGAASAQHGVQHGAVVLLCGARNVGKSSFGRLLVNRLLSDAREWGAQHGGACSGCVGWLECDPGQSEMAPAGMVSWHDVSEPLLGPPHTHVRPARAARFIGASTPGEAPISYVRCVESLLDERRRALNTAPGVLRPVPLVINTCGWVTGLGEQLLADLALATAPTHIIILEGPSSTSAVLSAAAAAATAPQLELPETVLSTARMVLRLPPLPPLSPLSALNTAPHAAESRSLQLLAYLGILPPAVHALPKDVLAYQTGTWQAAIRAFLASPPYTVPLHALERVVALPSADVGGGGGGGGGGGRGGGGSDAKEINTALNATLRALKGSLVGLLVPPTRVVVGASGGAETAVPLGSGSWADHEEAPATAPVGSSGWSDHECIGLGLVRAVDVPNGLIFVSTPAPPEQLARVRVLVRAPPSKCSST